MTDLMDAKAKVVAWLHTMHMELRQKTSRLSMSKANPFGKRGVDYDPSYTVTAEALVKLTDHEAALADLQKCFDFANSVIRRQDSEIEDAHQKHKTLLTGLEALAGEWIAKADDYEAKSEASDCRITKEWFEGMAEGHIDCANALTRTLASAGLEGKSGD